MSPSKRTVTTTSYFLYVYTSGNAGGLYRELAGYITGSPCAGDRSIYMPFREAWMEQQKDKNIPLSSRWSQLTPFQGLIDDHNLVDYCWSDKESVRAADVVRLRLLRRPTGEELQLLKSWVLKFETFLAEAHRASKHKPWRTKDSWARELMKILKVELAKEEEITEIQTTTEEI